MVKPELKISILSDYICPFCFIAHLRLDALRAFYDLKINWCLIEIHPETPLGGHSIKMLNYSDEVWDSMSKNLLQLADEEGVSLCEQTHITNSRKALLLAQAAKLLGAETFYPLHEQLFNDYFVLGRDIGDETVLRDIAQQNKIPEALIKQAWSDEASNDCADTTPKSLLPFLQYAGSLQAKSVPCFIMGEQMLSGVITRQTLLDTAKNITNGTVKP